MLRHVLVLGLSAFAATAHAQAPVACDALAPPAPLPASAVSEVPVAVELAAAPSMLGAPTGVLAQAYDESKSAEQVLFRWQLGQCAQQAAVTRAAAPVAVPEPVPAAAVPASTAVAAPASVPASVPAPAAAPTPESIDAATYVPRTEFDNTPWRFNMHQDGQQMTADAFAEWMESKGVRVATGRPAGAAPPPQPQPVQAPAEEEDPEDTGGDD